MCLYIYIEIDGPVQKYMCKKRIPLRLCDGTPAPAYLMRKRMELPLRLRKLLNSFSEKAKGLKWACAGPALNLFMRPLRTDCKVHPGCGIHLGI